MKHLNHEADKREACQQHHAEDWLVVTVSVSYTNAVAPIGVWHLIGTDMGRCQGAQ